MYIHGTLVAFPIRILVLMWAEFCSHFCRFPMRSAAFPGRKNWNAEGSHGNFPALLIRKGSWMSFLKKLCKILLILRSEFWPKEQMESHRYLFSGFLFSIKLLWIKFQVWLHKVFDPIFLRSWLTSFQIRNSYFSHPSVVFLVGTIAAHNGLNYFLKKQIN